MTDSLLGDLFENSHYFFCFFSYVSGAEINFKLLLIKFVPPSLGQQTVPANKTKHRHGKTK